MLPSLLLSTLPLLTAWQATAPEWSGAWCASGEPAQVLHFEQGRLGWLRGGAPSFYRLHGRGGDLWLESWSNLTRLRVRREADGRLRVQGEGLELLLAPCALPEALEVRPYAWPSGVEVDAATVAALAADLAARRVEDQRVRARGAELDKARMEELRRVDEDNVEFLLGVVGELGWIDAGRFGREAADSAFLIVQHSSDLRLMRTALPGIEADVLAGRLDGQAFALLFDRLQLNLGQRQRYGSQIGRSREFGPVLMPCEDLEHVDERRAQMGLGPLAEYLELFRDPPEAAPPAHLDELLAERLGARDEGWTALFNGRDLDGWAVKITGCDLDDNYKDTFRVEDGLLKVSYANYTSFDGRFGHLICRTPFSHYRLRVEYRFVGEQCPGGPGWAFRNSGVMLHGQSPESMRRDQEFPVSIEAQMLGGDGTNERSTANLCTPGTHVVLGGELVRRHCTNSSSRTHHGDGWVTLELEVRGNESIRHFMDGQLVLEYSRPQLDPDDADAARLLAQGAALQLESGYLSLQAESHPIEFRRVEIAELR